MHGHTEYVLTGKGITLGPWCGPGDPDPVSTALESHTGCWSRSAAEGP